MQRKHWMILSLAGALAFAAGCGQQAAPTGEASGSDKPVAAASATPAPTPTPAATEKPAQAAPEPAKAAPSATAAPSPTPAASAKPLEPTPAPSTEPVVAVVDDSKSLQLFKDNCMVCHGENLEGGGGPNLQKVGSKRTKEEIMSKINKGGKIMPAFEKEIDKADIDTLAAWLAAKK
jgi:mono/diheme cytochrome c family protein